MRVSAVSFLNAAPLTLALRKGLHPPNWEVAFDPPSRCAQRLLAGDADLGLVPSLALGRDRGLVMAAPLCIAAAGEVTSVLLFCGGEASELREVLLDPASRTSQALAKVLLEGAHGLAPHYEEREGWPEALARHQGLLAIGDRALCPPPRYAAYRRLDLAEEWVRHTGLPFVFAVWAGRGEAVRREARPILMEAYAHGRGRLAEIAREASLELGLPALQLEEYLRHHLHYTFSDAEAKGLSLFLERATGEAPDHARLDLGP